MGEYDDKILLVSDEREVDRSGHSRYDHSHSTSTHSCFYTEFRNSLLGKAEERTEMRYRMSMRGAMILAPNAPARYETFSQLRDLYDK